MRSISSVTERLAAIQEGLGSIPGVGNRKFFPKCHITQHSFQGKPRNFKKVGINADWLQELYHWLKFGSNKNGCLVVRVVTWFVRSLMSRISGLVEQEEQWLSGRVLVSHALGPVFNPERQQRIFCLLHYAAQHRLQRAFSEVFCRKTGQAMQLVGQGIKNIEPKACLDEYLLVTLIIWQLRERSSCSSHFSEMRLYLRLYYQILGRKLETAAKFCS
jgi:hypothetical protein